VSGQEGTAVVVVGKGPAVVTTRHQADTLGRLLLRLPLADLHPRKAKP
jgi:hypothetical protein